MFSEGGLSINFVKTALLNISFVDILNSIRGGHDIFGEGGFGINFEWAAQLTCGAAASSTPALCLKASP